MWAMPATVLGLVTAAGALCLGARPRIVDGVLEVCGGPLQRLVRMLPRPLRFDAITFGHVVVGCNEAALATLRTHEHVHVRQYERWGLFFFPAYLGSSLWQLLRGRHPYYDNRFEVEAFRVGAAASAAAGCEPGTPSAGPRSRHEAGYSSSADFAQ